MGTSDSVPFGITVSADNLEGIQICTLTTSLLQKGSSVRLSTFIDRTGW
jgi:hypothetical protein